MADGKFIEFLFEPGIDFPYSTRYKVAYQSLVNKPEQLFALLLEEETSKIFLSGFESYGKQLARLLEGPPEFFKSTSANQLHPKRDDIKLWLFGEALSVFLFSLIANDYPDIGSQESIADIAMAVIKLSRSGRTLELLGARLGEAPLILSRLIASSSMGTWSRSHPELFKSIVSGDKTLVAWTKTIADLAERCTFHIDASRSVPTWIEMQELVQSFPCNWCRPTTSDGPIENPAPRLRDFNLNKMGSNIKTFDRLLGEHLGPWKIILSAQALKDLKEAAHNDSEVFDHIRERLSALASGDWMRRSLRRPTKPEDRYKVPVYQVSCKGNVVILWQVDVAFDERHDHDFQAIKVWAISAYLEVEKMCESIIQAQGTYTSARVAACQTKDLEKIKRTIYPAYVHLTEAPDESDARFAAAIDSEASPIVADRRMIEGSPLLGKFYSLTTVVLDNVHPGALSAVFPVDVSGEEVNIINFFQRPAFILGRSGTGKTTCLIYKLASRYLSSRIIDETPVRQLLLTRSKNLAQKLRLYTKRLINTRMGIIDVDFQEGETEAAWDDTEEDTTQNLLSLGDQDFPLVCTFNYFLRLLENTIDGGNQRNQRLARKMEKPPKPVDFVTFSIDYWGAFLGF